MVEQATRSSEGGIVLSGMRATGPLHLGHYFGAIKNWVELQDRYSCHYCVADWHALTTDYADPSAIADNTLMTVADWLASGIDPDKSVIFLQSQVAEHAELQLLLGMLTPLGWLERVPTYKEQIRQLDNKDLGTFGFLGYPVLQTADIILYRAHHVPVGQDQASHLELSREITRRFNKLYGRVFPEPQPLFTTTPKVPGLDGRKMSKSYGNAIELSDDADSIRAKCSKMFTDPTRARRDDPGHPETCNLFHFHRLLSPQAVQDDIAERCRAATLGCVDDKGLIAERMIEFLRPIREKRQELLADRGELFRMLSAGTERARQAAQETMSLVRKAMGLDYKKWS